ncbi:acetyl-CoA hydrolase/transferase [Kipferlia bialata]|uniref:Acetyl-CoA hydrolase/transferase n=1 Tax=Kipferlia bialata TaxID=797122 RepID=A0A9K3CNG6_9EUKA|nr:acetyl-CoA hydrolase/transferase [Kipferlia bialata]|eukprot:g60.t1
MRVLEGEETTFWTPCFLSEIPKLIRSDRFPIDVAMVQVSTPDKHGFVSLGTSVVATLQAVRSAKKVIAVINDNYPRTLGDSMVHVSQFDAMCHEDFARHSVPGAPPTDVQAAIGKNIASLIPDNACLQVGFGAVPDNALANLKGHKGLGVHTEMLSEGVCDLVKAGAVTNEHKAVLPGKVLCSFAFGSEALYDFVDDNNYVNFRTVDYSNDPYVVAQNDNFIAINGAIEVDITGQIVADSIGDKFWSGVGGQLDFMRGAAMSKGGKPICALPSTTSKGQSRIVNHLAPGAGVVTTKYHADYVVTEHGIAELWGYNSRQRALALINIAAPEHRDHLMADAKARGLI